MHRRGSVNYDPGMSEAESHEIRANNAMLRRRELKALEEELVRILETSFENDEARRIVWLIRQLMLG